MQFPYREIHDFQDAQGNFEYLEELFGKSQGQALSFLQLPSAQKLVLYGPFTVTSGSIAPQTEWAVTATGLGISSTATVAYILDAGLVDGTAANAARVSWRHEGVNIATESDTFHFWNNTPAGGANAQAVLTFFVLANG